MSHIESRHVLCVHLKSWPINRLKRRRPDMRDKPLAVVETITGGKQQVVAACRIARARGVRRGMTLSESRALCADLVEAPHQPERDRRALESLGRWMMRFTPSVAIEGDDALLLDVTGCERLFAGWESLIGQADAALRKWKIAARLVIAPTAAGAWALAACGKVGWQIVPMERLSAALAPLPVGALRPEPVVIDKLKRVGITTIGQLDLLPRDRLPARFGIDLLTRLDRALGRQPESLASLAHREPLHAAVEFEYTIDSLEIVWDIVRELLDRIVAELTRRGCGARQLKLRFRRPHAEPIEQIVSLARPSRQAKNLFNLVRCSLESLTTDVGFDGVELSVPLFEKVSAQQITLHDQATHDAWTEWSYLVERLQVRLGSDAVLRPRWVESHLPEQACDYQPATADADDVAAMAVHEAKPLSPRPLCLLARPVEIGVIVTPSDDREGHPISFTHDGTVHVLSLVLGPERIAGPWWDGNDKTRDYFDVEDADGRRFWIFRVLQTWKWYLHGVFE